MGLPHIDSVQAHTLGMQPDFDVAATLPQRNTLAQMMFCCFQIVPFIAELSQTYIYKSYRRQLLLLRLQRICKTILVELACLAQPTLIPNLIKGSRLGITIYSSF